MLAVCANCQGTDSRLDSILENLLEEVAEPEGKNERFDLIAKCNLDEFLFEQMQNAYSYESKRSRHSRFHDRVVQVVLRDGN